MKLLHYLLILNLFSLLSCKVFIEKEDKLAPIKSYSDICKRFTNGNDVVYLYTNRDYAECDGDLDNTLATSHSIAPCLIHSKGKYNLVLSFHQNEKQNLRYYPSPENIIDERIKCSRFFSKQVPKLFDVHVEEITEAAVVSILNANTLIKSKKFSGANKVLKIILPPLKEILNANDKNYKDLVSYLSENMLYTLLHTTVYSPGNEQLKPLVENGNTFFAQALHGIFLMRPAGCLGAGKFLKKAAELNTDDLRLADLLAEAGEYDAALRYLKTIPERIDADADYDVYVYIRKKRIREIKKLRKLKTELDEATGKPKGGLSTASSSAQLRHIKELKMSKKDPKKMI
jgi:hypothetical protein